MSEKDKLASLYASDELDTLREMIRRDLAKMEAVLTETLEIDKRNLSVLHPAPEDVARRNELRIAFDELSLNQLVYKGIIERINLKIAKEKCKL